MKAEPQRQPNRFRAVTVKEGFLINVLRREVRPATVGTEEVAKCSTLAEAAQFFRKFDSKWGWAPSPAPLSAAEQDARVRLALPLALGRGT